jgi:hypothetical protein
MDDNYTAQIWTAESHGSVKIAECAGGTRDANAAHIVLACNAHDSLVEQRDALAEALLETRDFLSTLLGNNSNEATDLLTNHGEDVEARASAALALVKEPGR